jgi:hypothetical protein
MAAFAKRVAILGRFACLTSLSPHSLTLSAP